MRIIPLTLNQANNLVASIHRHHQPTLSHRFSLGAVKNNILVGAAILGRPVARLTSAYTVLEVTRLVTDGTKNACSILYAAAARVAKEMGFEKIQTFILESEPGTSLIAAGWVKEGTSAGGDWNGHSRTGRRTDQPQCPKHRYVKYLNDPVDFDWPIKEIEEESVALEF